MATRTKADLEAKILERIADNDVGAISPGVHRVVLQDLLDSGPIGIDGSPVLTGIQWVDGLGWQAVSDEQTQYLAVTAVDDFDTLRRALVQHLTAGGNENALPNIPAFISASARQATSRLAVRPPVGTMRTCPTCGPWALPRRSCGCSLRFATDGWTAAASTSARAWITPAPARF